MDAHSGKIRILILNNNEKEIEEITSEIVRQNMDIEIQTASSENEFVKKIFKHEPDVVIAPQRLHQYTGIEAYHDLRRALPFAFFILIGSAYNEEEFRNYSLTGIDAFLPQGNYSMLGLVIINGYNRKHLERTSHQSNRLMLERKHRLRSVFNHDQNAVFIVNFKSEILDLNPSGIEFLNAKGLDSLLGSDINKNIARQDLKRVRAAHASAFRGKKTSEECAFTFSKKDDKHAVINFVPIKNDEGYVSSVMMICKDVTDTHALKEKVKESEDRFYALANHAPVGIYYSDADGDCVFVNRKWLEYTGMTFNASLGKGWMKSLHPLDREKAGKIIQAGRLKGNPFSMNFRIVHTSGLIYHMRVDTAPYIDNEKQLGYIGTITHIGGDQPHSVKMSEASQNRPKDLQS
jgi:PAS domain S-box-containing protein